jgi:hypothetical protein
MVGSGNTNPPSIALLTLVLVPLVLFLGWAERPMIRLLLGLAASMVGLARLAIAGLAPGGRLAVPVLAVCAMGLAATLYTGRARGELGPRTTVRSA